MPAMNRTILVRASMFRFATRRIVRALRRLCVLEGSCGGHRRRLVDAMADGEDISLMMVWYGGWRYGTVDTLDCDVEVSFFPF